MCNKNCRATRIFSVKLLGEMKVSNCDDYVLQIGHFKFASENRIAVQLPRFNYEVIWQKCYYNAKVCLQGNVCKHLNQLLLFLFSVRQMLKRSICDNFDALLISVYFSIIDGVGVDLHRRYSKRWDLPRISLSLSTILYFYQMKNNIFYILSC